MTNQPPTPTWSAPESPGGPEDGARAPRDASPARRASRATHEIVAALALPGTPVAAAPVRPLPLPALHHLSRDTSMVYGIGRVDASGRVASRDIVGALGWQPGDRLEIVLTSAAIVLRACLDGMLAVRHRHCIVIPVAARRRHNLRPGDHVLLAAVPEYGVVIVHARAALDDMLAWYHAGHRSRKRHGHE